ncbi:MAG: DeoR/GlpR family DNA-binding transcription regulator [Rectinemataceae bacterium]|jgi:DeoR family deoxyribose operon repressor
MDKKAERLSYLTIYLKNNNASSIRKLSELLGVSAMTIRRDLDILCERHVVRFIHGGAVYNPDYQESGDNLGDYLIQKQQMLHRDEKIRIAKRAVSLLAPQETFMLDSGTTLCYLAKEIPQELPLTAICWSLNIIEELIKKPQCSLIALGGAYHPETQMFESQQGRDLIKATRASKAFISAGGIHPQLGVTSPLHYETETKKAAIQSSMMNILVVDSSKFGKVCTSYLCDITDLDIVITDSNIPPDYSDFILGAGIQLITV